MGGEARQGKARRGRFCNVRYSLQDFKGETRLSELNFVKLSTLTFIFVSDGWIVGWMSCERKSKRGKDGLML